VITENFNYRFAMSRQIAMTNRQQAVMKARSNGVELITVRVGLANPTGWRELA